MKKYLLIIITINIILISPIFSQEKKEDNKPIINFFANTKIAIIVNLRTGFEILSKSLIDSFKPLYQAVFILAFVLIGFQFLFIPDGKKMIDFITTIALGIISYTLIIGKPEYKIIIYDYVINLPQNFESILIQEKTKYENSIEGNDVSSVLITSIKKIIIDGKAGLQNGLKFFGVANLLAFFLLIIVILVLSTILIAYWLIQYTYIILATIGCIIGILIILGLPFKLTRKIFFNWVIYILEIALYPFLVSMLIILNTSIIYFTLKDNVEVINSTSLILILIKILITTSISIVATKQIPKIITLLTNNFSGGENNFMKALSAVKTSGQAIGKGTGQAIGKGASYGIKKYQENQTKKKLEEEKKKEEEEKQNSSSNNNQKNSQATNPQQKLIEHKSQSSETQQDKTRSLEKQALINPQFASILKKRIENNNKTNKK